MMTKVREKNTFWHFYRKFMIIDKIINFKISRKGGTFFTGHRLWKQWFWSKIRHYSMVTSPHTRNCKRSSLDQQHHLHLYRHHPGGGGADARLRLSTVSSHDSYPYAGYGYHAWMVVCASFLDLISLCKYSKKIKDVAVDEYRPLPMPESGLFLCLKASFNDIG